jgi:hypothetical protein
MDARPRQTSKELRMGQGPRQSPKGVSGALEVGDLGVERLDAGLRKLAGTDAILTGVQLQQLPDLLQCKPRRLRLPDEPQAPHVVPIVGRIPPRRAGVLSSQAARGAHHYG